MHFVVLCSSDNKTLVWLAIPQTDRKIKKLAALFCDIATSPFLSVFGNKLLADLQFLLSAPQNLWQHVTYSSRFLYSGHNLELRKDFLLISCSHSSLPTVSLLGRHLSRHVCLQLRVDCLVYGLSSYRGLGFFFFFSAFLPNP